MLDRLPRSPINTWRFRIFVAVLLLLALLSLHQDARDRAPLQLASMTPRPAWPSATRNAPLDEHPIPQLIAEAQRRFLARLEAQSTKYSGLVNEYKRRYGTSPPQGFQRWYDYARDQGHIMVDEYDLLTRQMQKYARLSPQEIRRRTWEVGTVESMALVHILNGTVFATVERPDLTKDPKKTSMRADGLVKLLRPFAKFLPDMSFAVSELPDPRVYPSWQLANGLGVDQRDDEPLSLLRGLRYEGDDTFWKDWARTCPPGSKALRQEYLAETDGRFGTKIELAKGSTEFRNTSTALTAEELCHKWPDLHKLHSQFYQDYRAITTLHPVFTTAIIPGAADIPFPSRYYFDWLPDRYQFKGKARPMSDRRDQIYWRGTPLPAYNTPPNHQQDFPRRRFLQMASTHPDSDVQLEVSSIDKYQKTLGQRNISRVATNAQIMDVAFSTMHAEQCGSPEACYSLHRSNVYQYTDVHDKLPRINDFTYLLDLDGLSYSARFHALLASGGAVLKSTIYREFYSDWIEPWVHYIPLSLAYEELYDIVGFFTGLRSPDEERSNEPAAQERQDMLGYIGKQAATWKDQFADVPDLRAYTYRMALEWARLYRGPSWQARSPDPAFVHEADRSVL